MIKKDVTNEDEKIKKTTKKAVKKSVKQDTDKRYNNINKIKTAIKKGDLKKAKILAKEYSTDVSNVIKELESYYIKQYDAIANEYEQELNELEYKTNVNLSKYKNKGSSLIEPQFGNLINDLLTNAASDITFYGSGSDYSSENLQLNNENRNKSHFLSQKAFIESPLAKRQVGFKSSFLIGNDIVIESTDPNINEFIQEFIKENFLKYHIVEWANRLILSGEIFLRFFNDKVEIPIVREIDPLEIVEVITNAEDKEDIIGFVREFKKRKLKNDLLKTSDIKEGSFNTSEYYEDEQTYHQFIIADEIVYFKIPLTSSFERGIGDLHSHLYWLSQYRTLLDIMMIVDKMKTMYIWDVAVEGNANAVRKEKLRHNKIPKPGSLLFHNTNSTWELKGPDGKSTINTDDMNNIMEMIISGSGIPSYAIDGDYSSVGSIDNAESTPMIKNIESLRYMFSLYIGLVLQKAFEMKGISNVKSNINNAKNENESKKRPIDTVQIRFADILKTSLWDLGRVIDIALSNNLWSRKTACEKLGTNFTKEIENMEEELTYKELFDELAEIRAGESIKLAEAQVKQSELGLDTDSTDSKQYRATDEKAPSDSNTDNRNKANVKRGSKVDKSKV